LLKDLPTGLFSQVGIQPDHQASDNPTADSYPSSDRHSLFQGCIHPG
jgi:hypothetical protein